MIDADDKLPVGITFKKVVMLMICVIKDCNNFYLQLFLDHALYNK